MLKIAIITNTTYETIIPLAKSLSKFSDVELFTIISSRGSGKSILFEKNSLLDNEKPSLVFDIDKKVYISDLFNDYIQNSFKINALYLKSLFYLNLYNFYPYWRLIKYIRKNGFDIIHVNIETPLLILLKVLFPHKLFFLTMHDPIPHSGEDDYQRKILRKYLNRRNGFYYIFHSQFAFEQFNKYYPKAGQEVKKVIPFGPHDFLLKYKQNNIEPKRGSILFFGRISPYKGLRYLIEGFRLAKKEVDFLELTIAGKGNIDFEVNQPVDGNEIIFLNHYINNELLCELIQKCEIVVCPYTDATQSGVIVTALTFGKPVLATDVGAITEVIKHKVNGYLIHPNSSEEIKMALIEIFKNNLLLSKITKKASTYFLDNSLAWEKIGEQTLEFYYESINNK